MKKYLIFPLVIVLSISMAFLGISCKAEEAAEETAVEEVEEAVEEEAVEEETVEEEAAKEPVTLVFWWWGEQEAPGLEGWMAETVGLYQDANPHVTVETTLQAGDVVISAYRTAAAAQEGPDLQYFWGGSYTVEDAFLGNTAPISDYIPEDELSHFYTRGEVEFDGKIWGAGWYLAQSVMVYNKDMLTEVGLDAENPPATWADFLAACATVKAAGYDPISVGDAGWGSGGAWLYAFLSVQNMDGIADIMAPIVGDADFTDPKYAEWWDRLADLRDNGYFNEDILSAEFNETQDKFVRGESAFTFVVGSMLKGIVESMGEDVVGVMTVPVWGNGKIGGQMPLTSQNIGISSWSPNKQEAANFIMFMHSPDRLDAMYLASGAIPADDRFDNSLVELPQMLKVLELQGGGNVMEGDVAPYAEHYIPYQFEEETYMYGSQDFFNGATPEEMAQKAKDNIEKWQETQPEVLEFYTAWYETLK